MNRIRHVSTSYWVLGNCDVSTVSTVFPLSTFYRSNWVNTLQMLNPECQGTSESNQWLQPEKFPPTLHKEVRFSLTKQHCHTWRDLGSCSTTKQQSGHLLQWEAKLPIIPTATCSVLSAPKSLNERSTVSDLQRSLAKLDNNNNNDYFV